MEQPHRRPLRLKGYDYAQAGVYFITICTHTRDLLFGNIIDGEMVTNGFGAIVDEEWRRAEQVRANVSLDVFVVMPNHVHGIVLLSEAAGASHRLAHACSSATGRYMPGLVSNVPRGEVRVLGISTAGSSRAP